ncbi:unnamed protein product, partial [Closterium sp. NIES-53]
EPACANDTMPRVGTIHWNPKPQRYLIALCSGGQLSNRLACLRQSMLDAALMNRTLVIPTQGIDYDYEALLDLGAFDECMGRGRVITFSAYNASVRGRVRVGRYICHVHVYQTDQACDSLRLSYEARLHASFAKHEIARKRTPSPWFKYPTAEFLRKFHGDHHVIAFANMFGVGGRELRFHGRAPLVVRPECRGLLQPSRAIQEAAVGFINTFLGSRFIAIHLRRGDFFHHCIHGDGSHRAVPCFHPIHQLARCLHSRLQALPGAAMVFVASNAGEEEMRALSETLATLVSGEGRVGGSARASLHLQALPDNAMVFVASNAMVFVASNAMVFVASNAMVFVASNAMVFVASNAMVFVASNAIVFVASNAMVFVASNAIVFVASNAEQEMRALSETLATLVSGGLGRGGERGGREMGGRGRKWIGQEIRRIGRESGGFFSSHRCLWFAILSGADARAVRDFRNACK